MRQHSPSTVLHSHCLQTHLTFLDTQRLNSQMEGKPSLMHVQPCAYAHAPADVLASPRQLRMRVAASSFPMKCHMCHKRIAALHLASCGLSRAAFIAACRLLNCHFLKLSPCSSVSAPGLVQPVVGGVRRRRAPAVCRAPQAGAPAGASPARAIAVAAAAAPAAAAGAPPRGATFLQSSHQHESVLAPCRYH